MVSVARVLENELDLVAIGMLCFPLFNLLHISHTDCVSLDDDCFLFRIAVILFQSI